LENRALRATMGERGRELVVREFDIKNMVEQITELYNELLLRKQRTVKKQSRREVARLPKKPLG
jgi:hypothetical protein